jgi:hypothetical protein
MLEAQAKTVRPTQAPRHDSIESLITPMIAAKSPDDHEPHPAVMTAVTANGAHAEAQHA